jgi:hypothetical protein
MSLQTNLSNFATRIATEFKTLRASIALSNGSLGNLSTASKGSLVAAINEIDTAVKAIAAGSGSISDNQTTSTTTWSSTKTNASIVGLISDGLNSGATKVYSIDKVLSLIAAARAGLKDEILGGSSSALDTLKELADALGSNPNFATAIAADIANRVRFDSAQTLTQAQMTQAQANLGLGNTEADLVAIFVAALS